MKTYKEALEKIVNIGIPKDYDVLEFQLNYIKEIATEALQSESEVKEDCEKHRFICLDYPNDGWKQCMYCKVLKKIDYPKSEERMYSEEEVFGFANREDAINMKQFLQSLQPKTEELKKGLKPCPNHPDVLTSQCGICDGTFPTKKQPTFPSKWDNLNKEFDEALEKAKTDGWFEKRKEQPKTEEPPRGWTITNVNQQSDDIEQIIIDQINQSFNEYQGTNEAIQDAAYFLARRFHGYKDRLEELELSLIHI